MPRALNVEGAMIGPDSLTALAVARLVQELHRREHVRLVCLNNATVHDHLIKDEVSLLKIEHDVQLALPGRFMCMVWAHEHEVSLSRGMCKWMPVWACKPRQASLKTQHAKANAHHILKIPVEGLHERVDELKDGQLILIIALYSHDEE